MGISRSGLLSGRSSIIFLSIIAEREVLALSGMWVSQQIKELKKQSISDPEKERQLREEERSAMLLAIAGMSGTITGGPSHLDGDFFFSARIETTLGTIR